MTNPEPDPTPHNPPAVDEELARLITANHNLENITELAKMTATYWMTLTNAGVEEEQATCLTLDWVDRLHSIHTSAT